MELLKKKIQLKNLAFPIFYCVEGEGEIIWKALAEFIEEGI